LSALTEKTRRPYQLFTAESNLLASELRKIRAPNEWVVAAEYFALQTKPVRQMLFGMAAMLQLQHDLAAQKIAVSKTDNGS
tara:strand:+ start:827 stop:1069 length:243 start_codon:yes stop_codon:yes gene_type:complete